MQCVRTNQADRNPFQCKFLVGFDHDGLKVWIFRQKLDMTVNALQALDRDFIANTRHHNLAVAGFGRFLNGE
ncbi:hypothetical protein D3C80_2213600 [compost metagenome]